MTIAVERKYALTKVAVGDYLLPSNDTQTVFRVSTYEDGPSHGLDDWPRDRTMWRVQRWTGVIHPGKIYVDTSPESKRWEEIALGFATRREASDWALRR